VQNTKLQAKDKKRRETNQEMFTQFNPSPTITYYGEEIDHSYPL